MITSSTGAFRIEEDALGNVEVPSDHLWGAQTERSHRNFPIGTDRYRWGRPVIRALGILKKCAALANGELGQLPHEKVALIVRAAMFTASRPDPHSRLIVAPGTSTGSPANNAAIRATFLLSSPA